MKLIKLSEAITHSPRFLSIEPYLREQDRPIASGPGARRPRIVPLVVLDYGSMAARIRQSRYIAGPVFKTIREMARGVRSIRSNPHAGKTTVDRDTLGSLEEYARSLGVTDIGYTKVRPDFIFKGFRILYANAIVFTMEMDREKIKQAPSIASLTEVWENLLCARRRSEQGRRLPARTRIQCRSRTRAGRGRELRPHSARRWPGRSREERYSRHRKERPARPARGGRHGHRQPSFFVDESARLDTGLLRPMQCLRQEVPGARDSRGAQDTA